MLTAVLTTTALTDRFAGGARIVNIGSIAAPQGSGSYGAAKAALESWTVGLARELGPRGITANLVAPGLVQETEFFREQLATNGEPVWSMRPPPSGRPNRPTLLPLSGFWHPPKPDTSAQVLHVNGGAYSSL